MTDVASPFSTMGQNAVESFLRGDDPFTSPLPHPPKSSLNCRNESADQVRCSDAQNPPPSAQEVRLSVHQDGCRHSDFQEVIQMAGEFPSPTVGPETRSAPSKAAGDGVMGTGVTAANVTSTSKPAAAEDTHEDHSHHTRGSGPATERWNAFDHTEAPQSTHNDVARTHLEEDAAGSARIFPYSKDIQWMGGRSNNTIKNPRQGWERGGRQGGQGGGRRGGGSVPSSSGRGGGYGRNRDGGASSSRGRKGHRYKRRNSSSGPLAPHPLGLDYGEPSRNREHDQRADFPRHPKRLKTQGNFGHSFPPAGPAGQPHDYQQQHKYPHGPAYSHHGQQQPGSGKRHRRRRRGQRAEPVLEDGEFRPPRLQDLKRRNRVNTRKFFSRFRPDDLQGDTLVNGVPGAPRNTTSFLITSNKPGVASPAVGGLIELPSPSPRLLPTPLATSSPLPWAAMTSADGMTPGQGGNREVRQDANAGEADLHGLRVNPYGSMNGCLRLLAPDDEGEEEEEEDDERGSPGSQGSVGEREGGMEESCSSGRTVEQGAQTHSSGDESDGQSSSSETHEDGGGEYASAEGGAVCGGAGARAKRGRVKIVAKQQPTARAHIPGGQRLQMQMVYTGRGDSPIMPGADSFLRARVDEQENQMAQLEEENLTLRERLYVAEQELKELRRRLGEGGGADGIMGECSGDNSGDEASYAPPA